MAEKYSLILKQSFATASDFCCIHITILASLTSYFVGKLCNCCYGNNSWLNSLSEPSDSYKTWNVGETLAGWGPRPVIRPIQTNMTSYHTQYISLSRFCSLEQRCRPCHFQHRSPWIWWYFDQRFFWFGTSNLAILVLGQFFHDFSRH